MIMLTLYDNINACFFILRFCYEKQNKACLQYEYEFYAKKINKHVFQSLTKRGCFMVSLNIICFHMYTSSLSLFPGRAYIYIWSVYFLNYWHLASPFPCSRMVFSDKTHKLCIPTSSAARRVNHKNIVCWGKGGSVYVLVCLYSNEHMFLDQCTNI